MKNQIREIKLREKNNYINNPTNKRIVLFERIRESKKIGKFFTWGKNSIKIKERKVLKSKENPENKSLSFLAKF